MKREADKRRTSRRSIIRSGLATMLTGLFGFVPTVKYLAKSPDTIAAATPNHVKCETVICTYLGKKCVASPCGGSTWVEGYDCIDAFGGGHCYYKRVDTGIAC